MLFRKNASARNRFASKDTNKSSRHASRTVARRSQIRVTESGNGSIDYNTLENRLVLATPVLPDMFSWASESRGYMYDYVVEGNLLRFTTALANKGAGNLELRGGATNSQTGLQEVWQRIYNDDGTYSQVLAGNFVYHPGHGHIHFDGYAEYHLREKLANGDVGDIVATGGKVSFCLIDITKYYSTAGNSNYNSCGQIQGVTAGWSDVYNRSLPDQWINITGVPAGEYYLQVVIDPDNQLVESDDTNNTTNIPVVIGGGAGSGGDRYETNNTFLTATNLGMTSKFAYGGMSIHNASDVDYFQFVAPVSEHTEVEIEFSHDLGNLDLFVYDSNQNLITSSTSSDDNESLEWETVEGQTYFIKVVSVDGDPNGYEFYVHGHSDLISEHVYSSQVPIPIPDSPGPAITSTLQGPNVIVKDLNLLLDNLEHTWLGDLRIELTSPAGTKVTVIQNSSQGGFLGNEDNFFLTTIDDQAPTHLNNGTAPFHGSFKVSRTGLTNPLAVFNNQNALGTWTLTIRDYAGQDVGTLREWGIAFTGIDQNPGDRFELNDYFPQAENLGVIGQVSEQGLSIHKTNDNDFFRFVAGLTTTASIDVNFSHQQGDLDFRVYDANLNVIAIGNSDDDNEHVDLGVVAGELYYLEVYSADGTNQYDLEIDVAARVGESFGPIVLTDQWQTVSFPHEFVNPVVVASPLSINDAAPAGVRIRNVTSTGFEVRISEWDYQDGSHANETASFLVMEAGRHVLPDGTVIEAGQVGITNNNVEYVNFSTAFAVAPVVLTQVTTQADSAFVVSRQFGVKNSRFAVMMQEQESADGIHAQEQVGWIAIGTGLGTNGVNVFEASINKPDEFDGIFNQGFQSTPMFFAQSQWMEESDPIVARTSFVNRFKVAYQFDEEQSYDPETKYVPETSGWLAISDGGLFVENSSGFSPFRFMIQDGSDESGSPASIDDFSGALMSMPDPSQVRSNRTGSQDDSNLAFMSSDDSTTVVDQKGGRESRSFADRWKTDRGSSKSVEATNRDIDFAFAGMAKGLKSRA